MTLGLLSLEGVSRPGISTSEIVSKALAVIAGFALLGQAFLDQQKEQAVQVSEYITSRSDCMKEALLCSTSRDTSAKIPPFLTNNFSWPIVALPFM